MKKVLLILGGLFALFVGFVAVVFFLVFGLTSGLAATAESFFDAVRDDDMQRAQGHLSEAFRANTNEQELRQFLAGNALTSYQSASWSQRSINNNQGELNGSVTTTQGGTIPLTINFIKEQGEWKIYAINKPAAGTMTGTSSSVEMPGVEKRIALARATTQHFSTSLEHGSMQHFHSTISSLWRQQSSPEELDAIFADFLDQNITLSLTDMHPVFDREPIIDNNDVLTLYGHYPGEPKSMHFQYAYIQEQGDWKLFGIDVNIR